MLVVVAVYLHRLAYRSGLARAAIAGCAYGQQVQNPSEVWAQVLTAVIEESYLMRAEQLSATLDRAVRPVGLTAQVLMVDLAQRLLHPVPAGPPLMVEATMAGRAYQLMEFVPATDRAGTRLLWVPLLDGTERVGVLRIGMADDVVDDPELRRWLWSLAGLTGHIVMTKLAYSIGLQQLRATGLSTASELLWQLLPPRTFATDRVVIAASLEPTDQVAGDAYDYAVDHTVDLAVFDGVGHDLMAGLTTTLAVTAIRNARRRGITDLAALADHADAVLAAQDGPLRFVTAVLARLDTDTGELSYLLAGHPPPLLLRNGRMIKHLVHPPRPPLGVTGPTIPMPANIVAREQLEPGDRVLLYSDGITEARDTHGKFFGEQRLVDMTERAELDGLSAPETLRRLVAAVLTHQHDRLQDDATLLLLEWARDGHLRLFPAGVLTSAHRDITPPQMTPAFGPQ